MQEMKEVVDRLEEIERINTKLKKKAKISSCGPRRVVRLSSSSTTR